MCDIPRIWGFNLPDSYFLYAFSPSVCREIDRFYKNQEGRYEFESVVKGEIYTINLKAKSVAKKWSGEVICPNAKGEIPLPLHQFDPQTCYFGDLIIPKSIEEQKIAEYVIEKSEFRCILSNDLSVRWANDQLSVTTIEKGKKCEEFKMEIYFRLIRMNENRIDASLVQSRKIISDETRNDGIMVKEDKNCKILALAKDDHIVAKYSRESQRTRSSSLVRMNNHVKYNPIRDRRSAMVSKDQAPPPFGVFHGRMAEEEEGYDSSSSSEYESVD